MPKFRHVRVISIASIAVTVIAVTCWGAVAVTPPDSHALAYAIGAAAAATPTAAMLWTARWLGGRGMVYMLDAMLSQRARAALAKTQPLRVVR